MTNAEVAQLVEARGSNPVKCGFDSHPRHSDGSVISAARGIEDGLELPASTSGQAGSTTRAATPPAVCPRCDGEGEVFRNPSWPMDPQEETSYTCHRCGGSGVLA